MRFSSIVTNWSLVCTFWFCFDFYLEGKSKRIKMYQTNQQGMLLGNIVD